MGALRCVLCVDAWAVCRFFARDSIGRLRLPALPARDGEPTGAALLSVDDLHLCLSPRALHGSIHSIQFNPIEVQFKSMHVKVSGFASVFLRDGSGKEMAGISVLRATIREGGKLQASIAPVSQLCYAANF